MNADPGLPRPLSPPLLSLRAVTTRYAVSSGGWRREKRWVHAAEDVSFSIRTGEIVGLVGESGSGKTTIGRTILRLEQASAGAILFRGQDILPLPRRKLVDFRRAVQAVFQDPATSLDPRMRVRDLLAEPLDIQLRPTAGARHDRVAALLAEVGLPASALERRPRDFSGGQRQRLAIARALAPEPELIIADEPVSALDVSVQAQIINLLHRLRERHGVALLFISHDLPTVGFLCDRVIVMYLGRIMEIADAARFAERPLHPYSRLLAAHVPRLDAPLPGFGSGPEALAAGDRPSPLSPPSGCVFRTRCRLAAAICAQETPRLEEIEPGHEVACLRKELL